MRALLLIASVVFVAACTIEACNDAEAGFRNFRKNGAQRGGGMSAAAPSPPSALPLFVFLPDAPDAGATCTGAALTSADGGAITFTRATVGGCTTGDLTYVGLTSGQPALTADGLLLELASKNRSKNSEDISDAGWVTGDVVRTMDTDVAPDGTLTGDTIADNANNLDHYITMGVGNEGSGDYAFSCFAKPGTDSFVRLALGATLHDRTFNVSTCQPVAGAATVGVAEPAANGWCRIGVGHSDALGIGNTVEIHMGDTLIHSQGSYVGDGGTVKLWGCMPEQIGRLYPTSYVRTASTFSVTRNATTATIVNPLTSSDTTWVYRTRAAPNWGTWLKGEAKQGLFLIGSTYQAANTADAYIDSSAKLVFEVYDSSATVKTFTSTLPLSAGSHDIRVVNIAGTLTAYDGADSIVGATTGTGTGQISTMPATVYLGSLGSGLQLNGRVMDVCIDNTSTGCVSKAAAALNFASAGTNLFLNGFVPDEPEWCVQAPLQSTSVMSSGGTPGTANSWNFFADAGTLYASVWDGTGLPRTRNTLAAVSGTNARMCANRGEIFLDVDDVPQQLDVGQDAGTSGTGLVRIQPTTFTLASGGCISRSVESCGSRHHYVGAIGDSLTNGPFVVSWPQVLDGVLPSTWGVYNYALGGYQTSHMLTRWRLMQKESHAWDYVSVMCCTNDILGGATAVAIRASLETLYSEIRATGARLIIIIASPFKWEAGGNWTQAKQDQAALVRLAQFDYCADAGVTCIDAHAAFGGGDGGDPDVLLPAFNIDTNDRVHLNDAGMGWLADAGYHTGMGL